jgi:DNA polymerase-3 subunit delta'
LHIIRPAIIAAAEGTSDGIDEDEAKPASITESADADADVGSTSAKKKLSREISIKQVRALSEFAALAATRGGRRICVIYPAEAMAAAAANALLKTLEEPSPGLLLFLLSDEPARLLPTIRSRCQDIKMPLPEREIALSWLASQDGGSRTEHAEQLDALGGAALEVLRLKGSAYWTIRHELIEGLSCARDADAITLARQLEVHLRKNDKERQNGELHVVDLATVVDWLQRWIHDALLLRNTQTIRYHRLQGAHLRLLSDVPLNRLHEYARWLNNASLQALHPVNNLLFLEDCLLRYRALF